LSLEKLGQRIPPYGSAQEENSRKNGGCQYEC
jgi:hypothetical protein